MLARLEKRNPGNLILYLLLPQLSAFLESPISANAPVRGPASVGLLVRWPDKCHMLPGKHPCSSLFHLPQQLAQKPPSSATYASEKAFDFIQSWGEWSSASAAAAHLSITWPMCKVLQPGRITRSCKYRAVWPGSSGTPAFVHYRCYIINKHRWLE